MLEIERVSLSHLETPLSWAPATEEFAGGSKVSEVKEYAPHCSIPPFVLIINA